MCPLHNHICMVYCTIATHIVWSYVTFSYHEYRPVLVHSLVSVAMNSPLYTQLLIVHALEGQYSQLVEQWLREGGRDQIKHRSNTNFEEKVFITSHCSRQLLVELFHHKTDNLQKINNKRLSLVQWLFTWWKSIIVMMCSYLIVNLQTFTS